MDPTIHPTTVLFVDDEAGIRDIATRTLGESHPHLDLTTLASPEAAFEHMEHGDVDCVVTDYAMPEMDGLDFLEAIRRTDPDLPVVFFTGRGDEVVASEAITAGVTDYILKEPGTRAFEMVGARVDNLVRVRRAERRARETDRRVRELLDRISDAVLSLDEDGRVTYLNEGAERLFGSFDDLEGADLPSLLDGGFERLVEEARTSGLSRSQEFELDEGDRSVAVTAYPSDDGMSVFVQDLTPLQSREAEIERLRVRLGDSESKFRTLKTKLSRPVPPNR
ncbi:response regulator [Salinirubellus salinus]|uniref:Response regulator n=1 Tax=Salinirubellus salinus TaxID=1364945 RepID=A0A9E7R619_9EURY|nr:response regulator [Salinirubellus salinus]UWM56571.1 response regulator [Salinirubellus salinus]